MLTKFERTNVFFSVLLVVKLVIANEIAVIVTSDDNNVVATTTREVDNGTEAAMDDKKLSTEKPFLLPLAVRPLKYKLEIVPLLWNFEDFTSPYYNVSRFSAPGNVLIEIISLEETSNVTLHAAEDMQIDPAKIRISSTYSGSNIAISNVTRDNETDFLVLHLKRPLQKNSEFTVFVEFIARIGDDRLNGMYLDYYINPETKEKRYLSTTLFSPNHARKAFPCFDEPGFKARFTIKIGRKNNTGYSSISNMPLVRTTKLSIPGDWVWDEFEETIPLPTYLVAMITTDFASRSIKDGDLTLKLHAPEYLLKRVQTLDMPLSKSYNYSTMHDPYLLQDPLRFIAAALRSWENTKLGSYPLKKVDIIALPHFFFSAMENMGAITFKYPVILNVQNITTTAELLRLSFVAGHEISHQWFGNMLTPKSWTQVWLKESFSDYFGRNFLSRKVNGAYNHDDFLVSELQRAMRYDGGLEAHPLENNLKSASDVGGIFTDIPYRKGASIVNMIQNFLTKEVTIEALESVFVENQHGNIAQSDLFLHLQENQQRKGVLQKHGLSHNISIANILNTWTQQSGYPVVYIRKEGSSFVIKQKKYENKLTETLKGGDLEKNGSVIETTPETKSFTEGLWWIPLPFYNKKFNVERKYTIKWLHPKEEETRFPVGTFYSLTNVEGYFRILYDQQQLHSILKDLTRQHLSQPFGAFTQFDGSGSLRAVDRSQLLDDYFTFAFSKYDEVPVSLLFHILSTILPYEQHNVVWRTFFQNMQKPYKLLQNTQYFPVLRSYLKTMLHPLYHFLTSQKQTLLMVPCSTPSAVSNKMYWTVFHSKVLSWICKVDEETCGNLAKKSVRKFMDTADISVIVPDDQETFYCAAVKYSEKDELDQICIFFEKMYFNEYYPVQRDRYLKALSCAQDKTYLLRLLSWTTNDTLDFHDIDRVTLLKNVISNPLGREIIMDFVDNNVNALYKGESVSNPVIEVFKEMVDYVNSEQKLDELIRFMSKNKDILEKKKKLLEKQIKNAKLNVLWMNTFADELQTSMNHQLQTKLSIENAPCYAATSASLEDYISEITDPNIAYL